MNLPSRILIGLLLLGCSAAYAGRTNTEIDITVTAAGTPSITSLTFPTSPSFAGGATDSTTVASISVTTSDGSSPTMSLTGTLAGSGNDADSFQIGAGPALLTHTSGGATDQAGVYSICIVASGSYSNSPQQACGTVQATGTGGAGWQLTFSDEFATPKGPGSTYMLEWQNQYPVSSYTWSGTRCAGLVAGAATGCGTVVLASAVSGMSSDCVSRVGACSISIIGATNSGAGGNTVVNGAFLVVGVSVDQKTLSLYMPYSGISTIGLGSGTTLGSGPWTTSIVNSTSTPQVDPVMGFTNNASEGWDTASLQLDSNGLGIVTKNAAFTSADGIAHTYTSAHIATWNGNAGFTQALGNGWAIDFYGMPTVSGGANSGIWPTWWSLGSDNSWPGTSTGGGEVDEAEFAAGNCALVQYDFQGFGNGGSETGFRSSPTGTFIGTGHQFTTTHIGGALVWYLDLSSISTFSGYHPTDAFYPMIDVEFPSSCGGVPSALPLTSRSAYSRVYTRVTSGACYSSIPAHGTVPHTGTC